MQTSKNSIVQLEIATELWVVKFCGFQLDVGQLKKDNQHSFTNEP